MDVYTLFSFALYDSHQNKFASFDPAKECYFLVDGLQELKIWDVWDSEMIPHIKADKQVPKSFTVKQLDPREIESLSFLSPDKEKQRIKNI